MKRSKEEMICHKAKSQVQQVLSSEWKTERVREDASGDSEDDELPCVIGDFFSYSFPVPGGSLYPLLGYFHHGDLFVISK